MDWQLLIADLRKAGWSQARIASACNCGQATISDLANKPDRDPAYALGQSLLLLHKKATRRKAEAKAA